MLPKNEQVSFLKFTINQLMYTIKFLLELIKSKENDEPEPKYRIVDQFEEKGVFFYRILIVGSGKVIDKSPESLMKEYLYLHGFNKVDGITIANRANFEKYKTKAKIASIIHENNVIEIKNIDNKRTFFCLENHINDEEENINNLIEKLSKKDAFQLGFLLGEKNHDINV
jgi:hypothetical protein